MQNVNHNTTDVSSDWRAEVLQLIFNFLGLFLPKTIVKRLLSLFLLCVGVDIDVITKFTGYKRRSIYYLKRKIKDRKYDELLVIKGGRGRKSSIAGIENAIIERIEKENYHTLREIADMIERDFGIKNVSVRAVSKLLKKNGYKKLKSGSLPAKADVKKQREVYDTVLKPLMDKAMDAKNNVVLLFMDASHFVIGCDFLGSIYCKVRRFQTTFSGRNRYNVLGVINYCTKKVHTITNDTYITATEICQMLNLISSIYTGKEIHIVLDNARYQKCKAVTELAKKLNIVLEYIPPYSPNLNLIERLWKFVKSELRKKHYTDFADFKKKIDKIISDTETKHYDKVCSLIGEKVQLFDEMKKIDSHTLAVVPKAAA